MLFFRKCRDTRQKMTQRRNWSNGEVGPHLTVSSTVPHTASLRLLLECDLPRSKSTDRRSRVRALLQHTPHRIFQILGIKQFECCHFAIPVDGSSSTADQFPRPRNRNQGPGSNNTQKKDADRSRRPNLIS